MTKNNILLVYPKPSFFKNPRFSFSIKLLQVAQLLQDNGYNVHYLDYSYKLYDPIEFDNFLKKFTIDVVILECDSFALKKSENVSNTMELLSKIETYKYIKSIVFGSNCIMDYNKITNADVIIKNNFPFKEILLNVDKLVGKKSNIKKEFDFDDIPFPNRNLLLTNDFFYKE